MRFLIVFALIGAALAVPKRIQRIVGGEETTIEQYPYMASMEVAWVGGLWWAPSCGGSLLTSRTILSAAHCYYRDDPEEWRVRVGSTSKSSGGQVIYSSELRLHPNYDDWTLNNDIAIIVLAASATFGTGVGVARIPGNNYVVPDNSVVTSIGWGATRYQGSAPDRLQHVHINVINQEVCAERYAYLKTQPGFSGYPDITDGMLCAGILDVGGKDACQGDSGGPLAFQSDIIVGVTSWGYQCAHALYPGVNARVSYFSDWIVQNASV